MVACSPGEVARVICTAVQERVNDFYLGIRTTRRWVGLQDIAWDEANFLGAVTVCDCLVVRMPEVDLQHVIFLGEEVPDITTKVSRSSFVHARVLHVSWISGRLLTLLISRCWLQIRPKGSDSFC